jgi:biotin carboxyl carrier protein
VSSKSDLDEMLEKLGMDDGSKTKVNQIFAPMPGLVLEVKLSEGDVVAEGESAIILEAMKMENIIKSPINGIVKKVHVKKGQTIEKNTLIISFKS